MGRKKTLYVNMGEILSIYRDNSSSNMYIHVSIHISHIFTSTKHLNLWQTHTKICTAQINPEKLPATSA
jgi:hypothetical protein